jgi:polyphenol oxidase
MWILKDNICFDDEFPFPNFVTTKKLDDMKDASRREKFCFLNGIDKNSLVCAQQVHGNAVVTVLKEDGGTFIENADGLVTADKGMALAMFTADCLPVFLGAGDRACGIAHAGWRGLKKNILISAVDLFKKEFRILSHDIMVSIGPHICSNCYNIGFEVREAFRLPDTAVNFALEDEAVRQLRSAGVKKILRNSHCTFHEPELFFSYRSNKTASRMMSVVRF